MSGPKRKDHRNPAPSLSTSPGTGSPIAAHLAATPRDPGDAWVTAEDGKRYWGRFGAAGLLAHDAEQGVLLQHRVEWSDHGNTWGIPGGARHEGEDAITGAIRESHEEAGLPLDAVRPRFTFTIDRGGWTYTTVIAEVIQPFTPEITDPESKALEWVPVDAVENYELHPGFHRTWPLLRTLLGPDVPSDIETVASDGLLLRF